MTRREVREAAFLLLFEMELNDDTAENIYEETKEAFELVDDKKDEFMAIVYGVRENMEKIDEIISKYSKTRAVSRIPKINIVLIRIAVYEMTMCEGIPDKVAINEALELSKKYADKSDNSFIGGLLAAYYREKNGENE